MYGPPDNFCLPSLRDATLISVQIGQCQVNTVVAPGGEAEAFTKAPAGAAALTALLGSRLKKVAGTPDGTLTLSFTTEAKIIVFDDSAQYESYQIHDGEDLIVVLNFRRPAVRSAARRCAGRQLNTLFCRSKARSGHQPCPLQPDGSYVSGERAGAGGQMGFCRRKRAGAIS